MIYLGKDYRITALHRSIGAALNHSIHKPHLTTSLIPYTSLTDKIQWRRKNQ